ncbi:UDP-glucose dehydrogenase family protein [Aureibacillus halotolerans]|uniref:UDP-glucose 6-dehydrogenase n=1 Tax=Aureibacillus halotolerans TaxID=1508390 RepID=A0A4R6U2R5_9BACI|nr:UDP-glucose/GDP-mannose dehydrogenase family protein [Aureibacillus halotolerans]TDQ38675.1 UDPglucose 6-dehydrogenase [Aureibacillus halotolerans]
MKRIAVIGTGYVGLVTGTIFAHTGNRVVCCDVDARKIDQLQAGHMPIFEPGLSDIVETSVREERLSFSTDLTAAIQEADILYIAVGTPMSAKGDADMTYINRVAMTIAEAINSPKIVVIKSTVPVGTGHRVGQLIREHRAAPHEVAMVSNPEFLREGTAVKDALAMERAVIGTSSEVAYKEIASLHETLAKTIMRTSIESAEMIKYASNAFLATKISFINDIASICEATGADVSDIARGMGLDPRIGHQFLKAGVGFGGSCFPKDTKALMRIAETNGMRFPLMNAVIETNERMRRSIVDKVNNAANGLQGKTVAVFGLAFKPDTNDMRDAPALDIIPALREHGATVKAYDPIAIPEAREVLGSRASYHTSLYEAAKGADVILVLTEWKDILQADYHRLYALMNHPAVLVDGRNCLPDMAYSAGFDIRQVGRNYEPHTLAKAASSG